MLQAVDGKEWLKKKSDNEQCSSIVSMYMFIEFGRLGCKHVIYLGDVYVHDFINVLHVHTGVGNA